MSFLAMSNIVRHLLHEVIQKGERSERKAIGKGQVVQAVFHLIVMINIPSPNIRKRRETQRDIQVVVHLLKLMKNIQNLNISKKRRKN